MFVSLAFPESESEAVKRPEVNRSRKDTSEKVLGEYAKRSLLRSSTIWWKSIWDSPLQERNIRGNLFADGQRSRRTRTTSTVEDSSALDCVAEGDEAALETNENMVCRASFSPGFNWKESQTLMFSAPAA